MATIPVVEDIKNPDLKVLANELFVMFQAGNNKINIKWMIGKLKELDVKIRQ